MKEATLDKYGLNIATFNEVYNYLADEYKKIYGDDIDLSQNTPDGQRIGIESKVILDLQSLALSIYNGLDVDLAGGDQLNRMIKLAGISRMQATKSYAVADIICDYDLKLLKGYAVKDDNNKTWRTVSDYSLKKGSNQITLYSDDWGKVDALPNTIRKPDTIILGVKSINNPKKAVAGREEETDEDLRIRRNKSTENSAYSTVGGLYSKLANLYGVKTVTIYENDTHEKDDKLNLNAHSLWIIIDGGDNAEIAEIIAKNKTAGCGLKGTVEGMFQEQLERPNGTIFYYNHLVRWSIPIETQLKIRLKVKRKVKNIPISIDLIKEKLSSVIFDVANNAIATVLYSTIYQASDTFEAYDLEISKNGTTWANTVEANPDEKFIITIDNIHIDEEYLR